ncbi:MAG: hypothetical protein MI892_19460 [Desulfobacterales bacterium]|nr:hypothetical protein [Desulfobacterales bacterium]
MMQDIHDIRPPVMTGIDPAVLKTGLWVCAGVLLAVLVVLAIRFFLKKRKKKAAPAVSIPLIPAYETASKSLNQLGENPGEDAKSFYFELGRIVKTYISGTFGLNCLEMTSQELARAVKQIKVIPSDLKSDINRFQDHCDPFRYAPLQMTPDRQVIQKDLDLARSLVQQMESAVKAVIDQEKTGED